MRYESYAQEMEDIILYSVLRDIKQVFYVDVGANDPINMSVTNFFYLRGGNGINIEPLRSKCLLLEEQRPRDINLCIGIGKETGYMQLATCGTGSTFDLNVIKNNKLLLESNKYKKRIITLTDIQHRYIKSEQQIHFCKIDVEGYEKEVLEGISDWNDFRPWIYVMESAEPGTNNPSYEKWEKILLDNGYLFAYETQIERYYIDEQKEHLLERFKEVGRFIKENHIVKMRMEEL